MFSRLLGTLAALTICLPLCTASAQAPEFTLESLMQSLAKVKTAHAAFVELQYVDVLTKPVQSSGTLVYVAPDHLEKNTVMPRAESLVLEEDHLTLDNPSKHQRRTVLLKDYPAIWAFVESIRSTLAGDLVTLNRFYKVSLTGSPANWLLVLVPIDPEMQKVATAIRIGGHDTALSSVDIRESNGDHSVMNVTEDAP